MLDAPADTRDVDRGEVLPLVQEQDAVRVSHGDRRRDPRPPGRIERAQREPVPRLPAHHRHGGPLQSGSSHVDGDLPNLARRPIHVQREALQPVASVHGQLGGRGEATVEDVLRQAPDPVTAHLCRPTVRVHVVHEEVGAGPPVAVAAHDPDEPVAADPAVAVTRRGNERRREVQGAVQVLDHHEVVSGSVVLGDPHSGSSRTPKYPIIASTAPTAPSWPTGNQRIRGSRRNHAI